MLVKAKKTMNGIVMGKTYESLGLCANKNYMIVINDNHEIFPYMSDGFHIESTLNKAERFKEMIKSKTYLIDEKIS